MGTVLAKKLAAADITTVGELLLYLPLRYEDRSALKLLADTEPNQLSTFIGTFSKVQRHYYGKRSRVTAQLSDSSGSIRCIWFNTPYLARQIDLTTEYAVSGTISEKGVLTQPTLEKVSHTQIHTGRVVPRYSTRLAIKEGTLRRILEPLCRELASSSDTLLVALSQLHFPETLADVSAALKRLALEELLDLMQLAKSRAAAWRLLESPTQILDLDQSALLQAVPFELTGAQQRALSEILTDLTRAHPMNRLLVGDVGSGKTIVAGLAAQAIVQHGQGAVLIAPTRILAEQHVDSLQTLLPTLKISHWERGQTPEAGAHLTIGTHGLIPHVPQLAPALVIYDEQHRFGTLQRTNQNTLQAVPHTLTMSATPIPRSMMLTVFSHLSLSLIDELPPGRIPSTTWVVPPHKTANSRVWMARQLLDEDGQALVVCPFIETSSAPNLDRVRSVEAELESWIVLQRQHPEFGALRIEVLHNGLSPTTQHRVIKRLHAQEVDLLIATPMIEVGVDLPAARTIAVHSAEQFGLASLHQLRGRVGRAGQESFCILLPTSEDPAVAERLRFFADENQGQQIAEYDMQRRGAGELFGTDQHGWGGLRFAQWTDHALIKEAQTQLETLPTEWRSALPLATRQETDGSVELSN